jgi:hypothetical protein
MLITTEKYDFPELLDAMLNYGIIVCSKNNAAKLKKLVNECRMEVINRYKIC